MIKRFKLEALTFLRNIYARIICPQVCFFCGEETGTGIPLCGKCLQKEITEPVLFRLKYPEKFCSSCGKILISEKELCTNCRAKLREKNEEGAGEKTNEQETEKKEGSAKLLSLQSDFVKRVYTLYPYKGRGGELLRLWKNQNMRGFAEIYASALAAFIEGSLELQNIPMVPVPPRPKKIKNKGWDQIEDLSVYLEHLYNLPILRCLKRKDGASQKSLSREKRASNLKGKIFLKQKKRLLQSKDLKPALPEKLIILDDVMTTGATLNFCAAALKEGGCKEVIGLCLFFD
ncbi:ComF family protein [Treponema sp. OMZ 792]|uniref:ComF family protein n=1 Tax=unclassified Treponema TaxID=2638727 RepID=UPI0020A37C75|nr:MULTISPECIES: ComF family protein [unclassified Treponema]UTC74316.1 ComF family protein [Treponema sp. OMZ 792]UTC77400.1 ComF family protein [Treponema sp. OMZ 799]UTC80713.1 ComF family protein [Treponema sp. OMZ 798]